MSHPRPLPLSLLVAVVVALTAISVVMPQAGAASLAVGPPRQAGAAEAPASAVCNYPSNSQGYFQATAGGDVLGSGAATPRGNEVGMALNAPIVGMARTSDGGGYWLVASDGGIFAFGDAHFYGSAGGIHLTKPVVGMAPTPDGTGYWLVASDGGIFAYGDAHFYGSAGGIHLAQPIVGMAPTPDGTGYWLAASDGGIFTYGAATFQGSFGTGYLATPAVAIAALPANPITSPSVPVNDQQEAHNEYGFNYYYTGATSADVNNTGGDVELCTGQPHLAPNDDHTLSELAVNRDNGNFIEFGIADGFTGRDANRLFITDWVNANFIQCGVPLATGTQPCGLVLNPAAHAAYPDMPVPVGAEASYEVRHFGQQWNLYYDGELLGYFPESLWGHFASASSTSVYSEVATAPGTTPTSQLGNGLLGSQPGADQAHAYQLFGTSAGFSYAYDSVPASYDVGNPTSTSYSFGGTGGTP